LNFWKLRVMYVRSTVTDRHARWVSRLYLIKIIVFKKSNYLFFISLFRFVLFFSFHFLHISLFRFDFVLLSLVSFYFVFISLISFRFVFVDFVSFRFVSFSLISFRFVSFLFRFALYRCPFNSVLFWLFMFFMVQWFRLGIDQKTFYITK
jgi:hypothetical protein